MIEGYEEKMQGVAEALPPLKRHIISGIVGALRCGNPELSEKAFSKLRSAARSADMLGELDRFLAGVADHLYPNANGEANVLGMLARSESVLPDTDAVRWWRGIPESVANQGFVDRFYPGRDWRTVSAEEVDQMYQLTENN